MLENAISTELVQVVNEQLITTSRKVAEVFEKQHKHIVENIKELENRIKSTFSNFQEDQMFIKSSYTDKGGRTYTEYLMNRDGFSLLVMGFNNTEKVLKWKMLYLNTPQIPIMCLSKQIQMVTIPEAFESWGWNSPQWKEWLESSYQKPKVCVYVLQLSNDSIKIGISQCFEKRLKDLQHAGGILVTRWAYTEYIDSQQAHKIECMCHKQLHPCRLHGEYFKASFRVGCDTIEQYIPLVNIDI